MLRKIILPTLLAVLAYGFWVSPDFKGIAAGVAIFLFGMLYLEEGFKAFTGGALERVLRRSTDRLYKSVLFGVVSTTIMQSSSLVSVITISFLSAGLLSLGAGMGIIFGANLGTTTGAWLVAGLGLKVKISAYAMPMLVFGIVLLVQKSKPLKGIGYVLGGLGFLFLGIHHMKEGFEAFRTSIQLADYAVPGLLGLSVFTLVGVAATVIMQSSHATLVLIITALAAEQITYDNALALAIGANVGTTITAIIGATNAKAPGKRLAAGHLVFNVITGILALALIGQFRRAVDLISEQVGIASDDYTLKLAVFHTLFNLVGLIVMLPLTSRLVRLLEGRFGAGEEAQVGPRFIHDGALNVPNAAYKMVRDETRHMLERAVSLMGRAIGLEDAEGDVETSVDLGPPTPDFDLDAAYAAELKGLHGALIAFIAQASRSSWGGDSTELVRLRNVSRSLVEAVKASKHFRKNLLRLASSENEAVRRWYRRLRIHLGELLKDSLRIADGDDPSFAILDIDSIKVERQAFDVAMNDRLDELIRQGLVTPEVASSLMNDAGYVSELSRAMISALEGLCAFDEDEPDLRLDDIDIEAVATADLSRIEDAG